MTISHSGLLFWATLYILKRIVYCVSVHFSAVLSYISTQYCVNWNNDKQNDSQHPDRHIDELFAERYSSDWYAMLTSMAGSSTCCSVTDQLWPQQQRTAIAREPAINQSINETWIMVRRWSH